MSILTVILLHCLVVCTFAQPPPLPSYYNRPLDYNSLSSVSPSSIYSQPSSSIQSTTNLPTYQPVANTLTYQQQQQALAAYQQQAAAAAGPSVQPQTESYSPEQQVSSSYAPSSQNNYRPQTIPALAFQPQNSEQETPSQAYNPSVQFASGYVPKDNNAAILAEQQAAYQQQQAAAAAQAQQQAAAAVQAQQQAAAAQVQAQREAAAYAQAQREAAATAQAQREAAAYAQAQREAAAAAQAQREAAAAAQAQQQAAAAAQAQREAAAAAQAQREAAAAAQAQREAAAAAQAQREADAYAQAQREASAAAQAQREAAAAAQAQRDTAAQAQAQREAVARIQAAREAAIIAQQQREAEIIAAQQRESAIAAQRQRETALAVQNQKNAAAAAAIAAANNYNPYEQGKPLQFATEAPKIVHRPAAIHYASIGQELNGDYTFGYHTGQGDKDNSFREEQRLPDGTVKGAYGYVDSSGKKHIVKYTAGKDGFKVEGDVNPDIAAASQANVAPLAAQVNPAPQPAYQPPSATSNLYQVPSTPISSYQSQAALTLQKQYQASTPRVYTPPVAPAPTQLITAAASAYPTSSRLSSRNFRKLIHNKYQAPIATSASANVHSSAVAPSGIRVKVNAPVQILNKRPPLVPQYNSINSNLRLIEAVSSNALQTSASSSQPSYRQTIVAKNVEQAKRASLPSENSLGFSSLAMQSFLSRIK